MNVRGVISNYQPSISMFLCQLKARKEEHTRETALSFGASGGRGFRSPKDEDGDNGLEAILAFIMIPVVNSYKSVGVVGRAVDGI